MGFSHNNVSPIAIEAFYLALTIKSIKSLQVLIFDGLVLHLKKVVSFNFTMQANKKLVLPNTNNFTDSEMLEIACLQMWRLDAKYCSHAGKDSMVVFHFSYSND